MLFAAMLVAYLAYELWHPSVEAQVGSQDAAPVVEPSGQTSDGASAQPSSPPHPLSVPPPPPVGIPNRGTPRMVVANDAVPTPPPVSRSARPTPSGRDFEAPELGSAPVAAPQAGPEENPAQAKSGVGYKSLLEADPNKPAAEVPPSPAAAPEPEKPEGKGFFHAIGRFFKGKKDTTQP